MIGENQSLKNFNTQLFTMAKSSSTSNNVMNSNSSISILGTSSSYSSQRFVVAIDFGTSHSGFAYSHKANETMIEGLYAWDSAPHPYSKTLTALLYDSNNLPIAWGYVAQQKYLGMAPHLRTQYTLMTKFKLFLDESYKLEPPDGLNAVVLIGDYLKFMKDKISDILTTKFGSSFSLNDVQWCLTVPAMWSDRAKHYTRKAAAFAGLIDDPSSSRLLIILEPEAAAVYVSTNIQGAIEKGDVFMIIDAGGGTVDLTVHKMRDSDEKRFLEVAHGLGKSCGSTFVDERFLEFFRLKVGEEAFDKLKQDRPSEIFNLIKHWEPVKRNFRADPSESVASVTIPNSLYRLMTEERKEELAKEQDGFDDCIHLHMNDMLSFFDPVVNDILALSNDMLKRCDVKVNKILCVGGFTESTYLVKRIREEYENDERSVICPSDPGATVVKGAVHYGLHPDVIASRRSRLTYGLAVRGYWDASFPTHKRSWDQYQKHWMVEDKFDKLVEIGEEVKIDHLVERCYYPPAIWSDSIRISLYATTSKSPRFVDEEGCFQQAEITIPLELKQDKSINDYPIKISVQFGATEISIKADNSNTGQQHHIRVNYDTQKGTPITASTTSTTTTTTTTVPSTTNNTNTQNGGTTTPNTSLKRHQGSEDAMNDNAERKRNRVG